MILIRKYIAKEFISFFLVCILSLVVIAVLFSTLAELHHLEKENGLQIFINNVLSGVPLLIEVVAPISVLLATVLALISLSKNSEIIAMMAAGVSLIHLILPILFCGIFIISLLYLNQSYLAPLWGADKRAGIVRMEKSPSLWRFHSNTLYYFLPDEGEGERLAYGSAFQFNDAKSIKSIRTFDGVIKVDGNWQIDYQSSYEISSDGLKQSRRSETIYKAEQFPVVFTKNLSSPKYATITDLVAEIYVKSRGAVDFQKELFGLYQKVSGAVSIFVMMLLALPFSIYSGRSANVRLGIVKSVVLGFVFWLADQILISLNQTSSIPMEICAFGANAMFLGLAFLLIRLKKS